MPQRIFRTSNSPPQTHMPLGKAAELGSTDIAAMATDLDLKSLRGDPRFDVLIAQAKQRAAAEKSH